MSSQLEAIEQFIQYKFKDQNLLRRALTHKSFEYEEKQVSIGNNEILEFLGDAVIDLAMSDLLMEYFPDDNEGQLSKRRASFVNEEALAQRAKTIGINGALFLGRGERATGGNEKPRLLCSALEALFGAVYKDAGYEETKKLLRFFFSDLLNESKDFIEYDRDYKTRYQEFIQREEKSTPTYTLLRIEGPPHNRVFQVAVCVGQSSRAEGMGRSKKQAEQEAARSALEFSNDKTL